MSVAEVSAEFELAVLSAANHLVKLRLVAPWRPVPRRLGPRHGPVAAPTLDRQATAAALRDTITEWRAIGRELETVLPGHRRRSLQARAEVLRDLHERLFLAISQG